MVQRGEPARVILLPAAPARRACCEQPPAHFQDWLSEPRISSEMLKNYEKDQGPIEAIHQGSQFGLYLSDQVL